MGERKTRVIRIADGVEFLGVRFDTNTPLQGDEGRSPTIPRTKAVYVTKQGSWVGLNKGQVTVRAAEEELLAVPAEHVGQLVTYGVVNLSSQFRTDALARGVDVTFLSRRGNYLGRLESARSVNVDLRRRQYQKAGDPESRLRLASMVVAGKLANLRALLVRRHRSVEPSQLMETARFIEQGRRNARQCQDIKSLLGIEGSATSAYFGAFARLLPSNLTFAHRERRPPRDPVNAALSFGYSLLLREAVGALAAAGLDTDCGFLHAQDRGRPSLALDLIEEFRPLIVDTLVLELFSRRVIDAESFRQGEEGACLLNPVGLSRFLAGFEERMLTVFAHVPSGQRTSYRRALFLQAHQLAAVVLDTRSDYRPVSWR
jgi:CRISPR-associated protein Cas1